MNLSARKAKFFDILLLREEIQNRIAEDNPLDIDSTFGFFDSLYFFEAWREYRDTVLIHPELPYEQYLSTKQLDWLIPNKHKVACYVVNSGIAESGNTLSLLIIVDYLHNFSRICLNIQSELSKSNNQIKGLRIERQEFERAFQSLSLSSSNTTYQQIQSIIKDNYPKNELGLLVKVLPGIESILEPHMHSKIKYFLKDFPGYEKVKFDTDEEFKKLFKNPLRYFLYNYLLTLQDFCKQHNILQPKEGKLTSQKFLKMALFFLDLMGIEIDELMSEIPEIPSEYNRAKLRNLRMLLKRAMP